MTDTGNNEQEDRRAARERACKSAARVFRTVEGKELLDELRRAYLTGALMGRDPYDTAYRVGQRDLVMDLIKLSEVKIDG